MEKGQEMKRKKCKRIEKKLTVRIVVVFLFTGSLAAAIYLADHRGYLPRDQNGNQVLTGRGGTAGRTGCNGGGYQGTADGGSAGTGVYTETKGKNFSAGER